MFNLFCCRKRQTGYDRSSVPAACRKRQIGYDRSSVPAACRKRQTGYDRSSVPAACRQRQIGYDRSSVPFACRKRQTGYDRSSVPFACRKRQTGYDRSSVPAACRQRQIGYDRSSVPVACRKRQTGYDRSSVPAACWKRRQHCGRPSDETATTAMPPCSKDDNIGLNLVVLADNVTSPCEWNIPERDVKQQTYKHTNDRPSRRKIRSAVTPLPHPNWIFAWRHFIYLLDFDLPWILVFWLRNIGRLFVSKLKFSLRSLASRDFSEIFFFLIFIKIGVYIKTQFKKTPIITKFKRFLLGIILHKVQKYRNNSLNIYGLEEREEWMEKHISSKISISYVNAFTLEKQIINNYSI